MISKHGSWKKDQTTELMQFFDKKGTTYSKSGSETTNYSLIVFKLLCECKQLALRYFIY